MNRRGISLGRVLGIPIELDYSWFLIFGLLTWMLAGSYYPSEFTDWPPLLYWLTGAVTAIMLFASVLLHELGHSVLALREGVPVKSITLFIFGGVAQIGREPPTAGAEFRIAIAGPLTSLGLAAQAQLAQAVGLPTWGLAGATDSKLIDAQAGAESAFSLLAQALAGLNLIHDVGYMDMGMCCSCDMLVLGDELIGWVRRFLQGIPVDDAAIGLAQQGHLDILRRQIVDRRVAGFQDSPGAPRIGDGLAAKQDLEPFVESYMRPGL